MTTYNVATTVVTLINAPDELTAIRRFTQILTRADLTVLTTIDAMESEVDALG